MAYLNHYIVRQHSETPSNESLAWHVYPRNTEVDLLVTPEKRVPVIGRKLFLYRKRNEDSIDLLVADLTSQRLRRMGGRRLRGIFTSVLIKCDAYLLHGNLARGKV